MLVIHVFHNDQWNGLHTASLFRRRLIVFGRHCCVSVRSSSISTQSCFVERRTFMRRLRSLKLPGTVGEYAKYSVAADSGLRCSERTIVDVCANADEALRCVVDCCFESVWTRPAMHWYSFLEFLYEHHRPRDFNLYGRGEHSILQLPRPRRRPKNAAGTSDLGNCVAKPVLVQLILLWWGGYNP